MSQPVNRSVNIYFNTESAQRALDTLNAKSDKLKQTIAEGQKAGKDMTKSVADLGNTQNKISDLEKIISGKMAPSFQMVKQRANELRRELERMSQDAPGYAAKFSEFEKVSTRLRQLQSELRAVGDAQKSTTGSSGMLSSIATGSFIGNAAQTAFSKLTGWFKDAVKSAAELSDSLSDIRKAAGLTQDQAVELNNKLAEIKTRTPTKDLREIAIGLGQIGQEATPEAVAAIDKIVVALGDEFGGGAKEITTTLGILRNNLQDIKTGDYGKDVLSIGNALNVLGAEGLATAPVVVDFANRMAGIAGTLKIPSGAILGLAATMQELGIDVERGSTAITKIFQKIAAEPTKFAKLAGVALDDFKNMINTDMLAAFNAVAVGAGKASEKNTVFAAVLKDLDADGAGAGEVLSKLSKNQELLAGKIKLSSDALKSSTSITEEFNVKNNNLAGTLEKIGKFMASAFAKSGVPEFINSVVEGFARLIGVIDNTAASLDKFRSQQAKVSKLESDIVPLIKRYDELKTKTSLSTNEQAELKRVINGLADAIPQAVVQFDKYGNAISISSDKAKSFIANQILMRKELNRESIDNAQTIIKDLQQQLNTETQQLESFQRKYKRESDAIARTAQENDPWRIKRQNQLDAFYGKGISELSDRVKNLSDRIKGQRAIIEELDGTALKKQMEQTNQQANPVNTNTTGTTITSWTTEEEQRKAAELLRRQQEFMDKIKAMRSEADAAAESQDDREIERVKNKYAALLREAKSLFGQTQKMVQASSILSDAQQGELDALYKKFYGERSQKEYDDTLKKTKSHFDGLRKQADDAFVSGEISELQHSKRLEQITIDEADAKAIVARDYADTVKKASDDIAQYEEQNAAKRVEQEKKARAASIAEYLAQAEYKVAIAKIGSLDELNARKALLQRRFEIETANMDKTSAMYRTQQANLNREMQQLDIQYIQSKMQQYAELGNIALQFYNTIADAGITNLQRELDQMKTEGDAEKESLQKRLDENKITKQQYNKEVERIDKAQAEKERELKRKQFEADKTSKLIQGGINLAMGISNIIATTAGNPILSAILVAAATALNGAQMAFIAAQKAPEYGKGRKPKGLGGVPDGPSHANGGIALVDPQGNKVGEMEGNEPILSVATYRNNRPLVDALLDSSMYGGGKKIDMGWATDSTSLNVGRITSSITEYRYATGRWPGYSSNTSQNAGFFTDADRSTIMAMVEQMKQGVRAYTYYNETDRINNEIATLKRESSSRPR